MFFHLHPNMDFDLYLQDDTLEHNKQTSEGLELDVIHKKLYMNFQNHP